MFSVIMPLYNKVDDVKKAIMSVLNQSYIDFELIIVNDGSTDGSLKQIEKIINPKFKVISQNNFGVSSARNTGIKLAKYSYIAFLDADDWWEMNFLQEMYDLIQLFPNAGIYSSNFFKIKNASKIKSGTPFDLAFEQGYIDYFHEYNKAYKQLIFPSCAIIPKFVLEEFGGFHVDLSRGEDFFLWVQIALKYKVAYLNKYLSNYNQDSDYINRATKKIHSPNANYVFHFKLFILAEKENQELRKLLNHIRIGNYKKYIKSELFVNEAKVLLKEADLRLFSGLNIIIKLPCCCQRHYFYLQDNLSKIKRFIK
jgi:glycosyltransferase involved in cell wall biosynthesis